MVTLTLVHSEEKEIGVDKEPILKPETTYRSISGRLQGWHEPVW